MNYNRTPDTGSQIYMDEYSCNLLRKELQASETAEESRIDEASGTEMQRSMETDCQPRRDFESWPLAMAYVPMQSWEEPFELAKGLRAGTIFPSLRLPFRGGGC